MATIEDNVPIFISITNCPDATTAHNYLEMSNNDLNQAIQLYFDTGGYVSEQREPMTFDPPVEDDYQPPMSFSTGVLNHFSDEEEHQERVVIPEIQYGGVGGYFENLIESQDESSEEFELSEEEYSDYNSSEESDDSDIVEIDYNGNLRTKETHAEKLKRMFSKPTDIIFERGHNIDTLKKYGQKKNKWILINIQDVNNFECMKLNRDIWSDLEIKNIIRRYFLFNQFEKTQRSGREYMLLYPLENKVPGIVRTKNTEIVNDGVVRDEFGDRVELPVIGIIDPLTGALMESWNGGIQNKRTFIDELNKFVELYVNNNPDAIVLDDDNNIEEKSEEVVETISFEPPKDDKVAEDIDEIDEYKQLFDSISPIEYTEPPASSPSTRIQFRIFNNGKRLVKKFALESKIEVLFAVCKSDVENFPEGEYFELHVDGSNLIEHLGKTIDEKNLKMSSLTVEFIE